MQCCLDGDIDDRFQRMRPNDFSLDTIWHKKLGFYETLTIKVVGSLLMPRKRQYIEKTLSEFPIIDYEQAQFYFRHYPNDYPKAPKPNPKNLKWVDKSDSVPYSIKQQCVQTIKSVKQWWIKCR